MTNKNIIKNPHILNITLEQEQYDKLRKIAFNSRKSIARILREWIDEKIAKI